MLADILLALAILYSLQIIVFSIATWNARYDNDLRIQPTVSIIIAARNEEQNIRQCLESILRLSYPLHLLEVMIVNDRSTDATASIVQEYTQKHNQIKLITTEPETGHLRGKTNAVTQGIEATTGEIIMFTDADCVVPNGWVEETVKYYTHEKIGIVAGFTSLRSKNWFEAIQAIDWFFLFSVAAAAIRLGFPVTAVGNNFSVRRKAYDEVGGYRNIPFSVTEDYALFHAVTSQRRYGARFPLDAATLVQSNACRTWAELYLQRKRWFTGGLDMEAKNFLIFGGAYALNIFLIVSCVVGGVDIVLVPLLLKLGSDFVLAIPTLLAFDRKDLLRYFFHFQTYYLFYLLVFPVVVLLRREVVWKERSFGE